MATSRDASPAPSSQGSTISDPDQDARGTRLTAMDVDTEDAVDSPLPATSISHLKPLPANLRRIDPNKVRKPRGGGAGSSRRSKGLTPRKSGGHVWISEAIDNGTEDETGSVASGHQRAGRSPRGSDADARQTVGTAIGTRRQANGTIGSVYSGNKIRHIKKDDGTPLWRRDIQHQFLQLVVEDETPVFTRVSDGHQDLTFVDVYIDAMARSSKTSKILKDRLQSDKPAARNMAMICLLVNVGRMNTTLNFFPEMRAQLRTYHSIPSLQAYKSQRDYKSLQDAPRLKSILKGASEDNPNEPHSLEALRERTVPRTNPVNLIFILSHYAPKISETHFSANIDFFDLVIRPTISSASRARAFLWLMWWYLESDFTKEDAMRNPFGSGTFDAEGPAPGEKDVPLKVPELEIITEAQGDEENFDPPFEHEFADRMAKERKRILLEDGDNPDNKLLQRVKKSGVFGDDDLAMSDADSAVEGRGSIGGMPSPAPVNAPGVPKASATDTGVPPTENLEDDWDGIDVLPPISKAGRGGGRRAKSGRGSHITSSSGRILTKSARAQALERGTPDTVDTPVPSGQAVLSQYGRGRVDSDARDPTDGGTTRADGRRKPRPLTQHQRALEHHRRERVEYALALKKRVVFDELRSQRESENWLIKAARRVAEVGVDFDSDDNENGSNNFGLAGLLAIKHPRELKKLDPDNDIDEGVVEANDEYGEEAESWARIFRRTKRRLEKWEGNREVKRALDDAIQPARDSVNDTTAADGYEEDNYKPPTHVGQRRGDPYSSPPPAMAGEGDTSHLRPPPHSASSRAARRAAALAQLDEIDRSLLAERSDGDEDMADDDGDDISGSEGEQSDIDMD